VHFSTDEGSHDTEPDELLEMQRWIRSAFGEEHAVVVQPGSHAGIQGDGQRGGNPSAWLSRVEYTITDRADWSRHENWYESNDKESTVSAHGERVAVSPFPEALDHSKVVQLRSDLDSHSAGTADKGSETRSSARQRQRSDDQSRLPAW
jgi:hypothetical protein